MASVEYIEDNQDTSSVLKDLLKNSLRAGTTKEDYSDYISSRRKVKDDISVVHNR